MYNFVWFIKFKIENNIKSGKKMNKAGTFGSFSSLQAGQQLSKRRHAIFPSNSKACRMYLIGNLSISDM